MATTPASGIDWTIVTNIGGPILGVVIGAWANKMLEQRPKLVSFFGHVSTFRANPGNVAPFLVFTHTIVLRNNGRSAATNVRLTHKVLPDFNLFPPMAHTVEDIPGGGKDILIPRLVSGQQVVLSYMYLPPMNAGDVHAGISSDQGFAKELNVLLQPVAPKWFIRTILGLMLVGLVTLIYLAQLAVRHWLA